MIGSPRKPSRVRSKPAIEDGKPRPSGASDASGETARSPQPGTAPVRRFRHTVSAVAPDLVQGWVYDLDNPGQQVRVRIVLEQPGAAPIDLAVQTADRPSMIFEHPDLGSVPIGFQYRVPAEAGAATIRVFELTTNLEFDGSPLSFAAAPQSERPAPPPGGSNADIAAKPLDLGAVIETPAERSMFAAADIVPVRRFRHHVAAGGTNRVEGWIFDPDHPAEQAKVRIFLEQRWGLPPIEVAVATACLPCAPPPDHPDTETVPIGFECRIPVQGDGTKIRVFELTTNVELDGSPIHFGIAPQFEGFLDGLNDTEIYGWAWATRPDYWCEVDVLIDGRYRATVFATERRVDLAQSGIGDGTHAFRWPIPLAFFDGEEHEIACLFHGTSRHLAQSPARRRLSLEASAAIGSDGMLRGTVAIAGRHGDGLPIDLLLDARPLARVLAQPSPLLSSDRPSSLLSYEFAVPVPPVEGVLEIAPALEALASDAGRGLHEIAQRGATTGAPLARSRHRVGTLAERYPPATMPDCRNVDGIEQEWIERSQRERTLAGRKSKLLIPIWGPSYIEMFCELCLPSLLARNNLPKYVEQHKLTVTILTRSPDITFFDHFPAIAMLRGLAEIDFVPIDDILTDFFDPRPQDIYSVALTYAFFRGIAASGAEATSTDFIFWNADFLAGDGTFATLADIVARGGRCTMAASLRTDLGALDLLRPMVSEDGTTLQVAPRDLVRIALAHPHPTVEAQTLNRHSDRVLSTIINRLCWQLDDDVLIGRYFLLYMLHIRPERVWDEVNGPCDYAFVPELVPNSEIVYECNSDRICIIEPQHREKEVLWINSDPLDIATVAKWIDYWATAEHIAYSKALVVFNGGDRDAEQVEGFDAAVSTLDRFMAEIYSRLGEERLWHNLHVYWRSTYQVLEREAPRPGPDRPRSRAANIARWTGYDLDVIKDSWGDPPPNLRDLFFACPEPQPTGDGKMSRWLDALFEAYLSVWPSDPSVRIVDKNPVSLVSIRQGTRNQWVTYQSDFYGCRWGPAVRHDGAWYRLMGPDGCSILLHRTTQCDSFAIEIKGRRFAGSDPRDLNLMIGGDPPAGRTEQTEGVHFTIRLYIAQSQVISCEGRLVITIVDTGLAGHSASPRFAFSGYEIRPYDSRDLELEDLLDGDIVASAGRAALAGPARAPGIVTAPSLMRLRALHPSLPDGDIAIDLASGFLGVGWKSPFARQHEVLRWVEGHGAELLVVRVAPGRDHRIEFVADRALSTRNLVIDCTIEVNGNTLPNMQIETRKAEYRLTARLPRGLTTRYDGWVALRLIVDWPQMSSGHGHVEYGEPAAGGIAVTRVRAVALPDGAAAPHRPTADGPAVAATAADPVGAFWKVELKQTLPQLAARRGTRRQACRLMEIDYSCYEDAVRRYGGRVRASWLCCQVEATGNAALASAWLDGVDREITQIWRETAGAVSEAGFDVSIHNSFAAAGLGEVALAAGRLARTLPKFHATRVFLRLSRQHFWIVEFDLHCEAAEPAGVRVELDDVPIEPVMIRLSAGSTRVAIAIPDHVLESCGEAVIVKISQSSGGQRSAGVWLTGVRAKIDALPQYVETYRDDFIRFHRTAERFGLDPELYVAASRSSGPELARALAGCPVLDADEGKFAAVLFSHLDRVLAASIRLDRTGLDGLSDIDLCGAFDGFGWGTVKSFGGRAGRQIGLLGRAAILLRVPVGDTILIALDCVGEFAGPDPGPISLSANGAELVCREELIDEHTSRLHAAFTLAEGGNVVLGITVPAGQLGRIGVLALTVRRPSAAERLDGDAVRLTAVEHGWALALAAGLRLPERTADLERLPGITQEDVVLWRFGRDPSLYRSWVERGGEALRQVFASCPPAIAYPAPATRAWLDLLDRTVVEALIAGPPPVANLCPVLHDVYGLGWGALKFRDGILARGLSGTGDAMLFIPPGNYLAYAVEIGFTADSDRQTLLSLKVSANRRAPVQQALVFAENGPTLRVEIDPSVSDFGLGWVALRLWIGESENDAVAASFRSSITLAECDVAVRSVAVSPQQIADRPLADPLVADGEPRRGGGRARPLAQVPSAVHCVVPVWGAEYLKTFLRLALPAHLAAGNLPALAGTKVVYEIYTDAIGRQTIEQHKLYPALAAAVDEVVFFDIDSLRTRERHVHQLNLNYALMNNSHQSAIRRATAHDGALLFLNCDTVYSEQVFARIWERAEAGYRAIENLSIRTDRDQMLAALEPYTAPDGTLGISSLALTAIALPRFHAIAQHRFWEGPPGLTIPDHIYWPVAESAILARATHYMPLFVYPRTRDVAYLGTIDHGFIPASGISDAERWFMASDTEPSSYELSLVQHDQRFRPYERGSPRDIARFLSQLCENFHLHNLGRPVRIAAAAVPEERWREVERESAEILQQIRQRLQKYVLTAWRPDFAAEADEREVVWSLPSPADRPIAAELALAK